MNGTFKELIYSILLLFGLLFSITITLIVPIYITSYLNIKILSGNVSF